LWKEGFSLYRFLFLWIVIPIIFFSIPPGKLALYILPIYSGVALAGAYVWNGLIINRTPWVKIFLVYVRVMSMGMLISTIFIKNLNLSIYSFLIVFMILGLTVCLSVKINTVDLRSGLVISSFVLITLLVLLSHSILRNNDELVHDQQDVAAFIHEIPDVESVYVFDERLPSLAFYLNRDIISIQYKDSSLDRETH
jgi:4-amino-4-deoxy-L-arabinose transferase